MVMAPASQPPSFPAGGSRFSKKLVLEPEPGCGHRHVVVGMIPLKWIVDCIFQQDKSIGIKTEIKGMAVENECQSDQPRQKQHIAAIKPRGR